MRDIGLVQQELAKIVGFFHCHEEIEKVILFGSRAKGTFKPNSDIDIAVEGIRHDLQIESLAMEFDELPLPYKFDVKAIIGIRSTVLQNHIDRVGIIIYPVNY